jgi:hypothetical protein
LDDVTSPSQSTFVLGRLISDNILVTYEITHFLLNKRDAELGYAALKLDINKAYNRVEWNFLEKMMRCLGFDYQWISLIMECVSTISYTIEVNWDLTDSFKCEESFSALLQQAEQDGRIAGAKVCQAAPSISHLLFTDDSLILIRANEEDAQHLQDILDLYEQCSG